MALTLSLAVALERDLGHTDNGVGEQLCDGSAPGGGMELCGECGEEGIVIVCVSLDEELCGRFAVRRSLTVALGLQRVCICPNRDKASRMRVSSREADSDGSGIDDEVELVIAEQTRPKGPVYIGLDAGFVDGSGRESAGNEREDAARGLGSRGGEVCVKGIAEGVDGVKRIEVCGDERVCEVGDSVLHVVDRIEGGGVYEMVEGDKGRIGLRWGVEEAGRRLYLYRLVQLLTN